MLDCCDYCGDMVELTEQCTICNFDLCSNDIEPVMLENDFVMVCNLCTVRYYQTEEIENLS